MLCSDEILTKRSTDTCYLSWTSKGTLLINRRKDQLRKNEIVNTLKSMDIHFGKFKFRSGNIPFTLFGKFDDKTDVLFKDATDNFKTDFEIRNMTKFDGNVEEFYDDILKQPPPQCSMGSNFCSLNSMILIAVLLVSIII